MQSGTVVENEGRRRRRSTPRSPSAAALLSFLWPGLGHLYMGRRVASLLYAIPPLLTVAALLSLVLAGLEALVGRLFDPTIALLVLTALIGLGLWRLAAMVHAWWLALRRERKLRRHDDDGPGGGRRTARLGILLALAAIVIAVHAVPASWAYAFYQAGNVIFQPPPRTSQGPALAPTPTPNENPTSGPSPTPFRSLAPGETAAPTPEATPSPVPGTPIPTLPPPAADGLTNVLFVGTDALPGRPADHRLTDSIILASFDRARGALTMISIPRNIARFPQYWGGIHEGKINTLLAAAQDDPGRYPDGPMGTFVGQISYLLGVDIDYYASVDIPGFERLVDAVGGVDVVVTEPIADPAFPFYMDVGTHHLDGPTAVMFVRSRRGPGGSNEERSIRQQHLLLQLRGKLSDPAMLPRLPEVLDAIAATIRTNLPPDQLDDTLALARQATGASVRQYFLGPETYATALPPTATDLEYAVELKMDEVAALSRELWGEASYYSKASYYENVVTESDVGR